MCVVAEITDGSLFVVCLLNCVCRQLNVISRTNNKPYVDNGL